jgi:hypothetical protein
VFNSLSVKNHQYGLATKRKNVWNALTAIVKVISLKCVVHKTKPANIVTCMIKKEKTPVFQEYSCSISFIPKYIFLKR